MTRTKWPGAALGEGWWCVWGGPKKMQWSPRRGTLVPQYTQATPPPNSTVHATAHQLRRVRLILYEKHHAEGKPNAPASGPAATDSEGKRRKDHHPTILRRQTTTAQARSTRNTRSPNTTIRATAHQLSRVRLIIQGEQHAEGKPKAPASRPARKNLEGRGEAKQHHPTIFRVIRSVISVLFIEVTQC